MSFYGHHPSYLFKLQRTEEVRTMEVRFLNLSDSMTGSEGLQFIPAFIEIRFNFLSIQ